MELDTDFVNGLTSTMLEIVQEGFRAPPTLCLTGGKFNVQAELIDYMQKYYSKYKKLELVLLTQ